MRLNANVGETISSECENTQYDKLFADYTELVPSRQSRDTLMKQVEEMLDNGIFITWNNVRTLLIMLQLKDTEIELINRANACVRKIHERYAGEIPKDISEWFADI